MRSIGVSHNSRDDCRRGAVSTVLFEGPKIGRPHSGDSTDAGARTARFIDGYFFRLRT